MRALLIDPFTRTVTMVDVSTLEDAQEMIGSTTLGVSALSPTDHMVLDTMALEKEDARFFLFGNSPQPIAGCALIRGNSPDGLQVVDTQMDHILVTQAVQFPAIAFDGWQTVPKFRPLEEEEPKPAPQPQPVQEKPQAKPAGKPWSIWTIREDVDAGYVATLVAIDGAGKAKNTGKTLEHDDLDELRAMLPPSLTKVERTETDDPSIVESWVTQPKH